MSLEENMEELLNISAEVVEEPKPVKKEREADKDDRTKDYEYTRGELYSLIDQGQEAVRGALEVAQESGHPRAYEVAVAAMKHVADMTEKLQDLHKKMKDLDEEKKGPTKVTNNAMFVGSTAELQKMLKQMNGNKR
ncbi:terminase small subunit [Synechococcus phage S-H9-1]|uniref:Terminase small subunit n=1 Tax=Synechococcus phage S-H9-1 TaxID=2783674 RepID=A0A873WAK2_9CAUD|nr:terminase small subunit [Synechococcus phage S-H9-1]QPB08247.1 terminase small subunit [Synechococcus phage S-H9-1]